MNQQYDPLQDAARRVLVSDALPDGIQRLIGIELTYVEQGMAGRREQELQMFTPFGGKLDLPAPVETSYYGYFPRRALKVTLHLSDGNRSQEIPL